MKPIGKIGIFMAIGGLVLVVGLFIGDFFVRQSRPEPLPNPNGYDDFVAAGEMLTGKVPDEKTGSLEERRQFVSANRVALDRGRSGLGKPCRVPTEYSVNWMQRHTEQIMVTRELERAFCVEGELARLENRPDHGVTNYLTAIKMGAVLAHGGLMIDGVIATACEVDGEIQLESEIETLDIEQSRKLIKELENVEAEREPSAQIIKHEKKWMIGQLGSLRVLRTYLSEVAESHSLRPDETEQKNFLAEYDARLQWELQVKAKLAAHAYILERRRLPTTWNDLVPTYLKSVPNVPFGPGDTNRLKFTAN